MRKSIGALLGVATVMTGTLVATLPAGAAVPNYQLCNSKSGYTVCIERDGQGWHARAWGPDWIWAALYNGRTRLESHWTPPGGNNERTGGHGAATIACAGHQMWGAEVVCVSPQVKM
ncbi:hypothetical protein OG474_21890 [Kribbella sp. NBC_01505]|uniref:hypothetical protein n=1 Tax=Kribbella sp. NBC_01505 TaxID=2903580 RepID=UPI00386EC817